MEKMVKRRNWKRSMRLQQTQFGILNILDILLKDSHSAKKLNLQNCINY